MSGAPRTIQDARKVFNTNWNPNYDDSAPSYEKDLSLMEYMAHHHTVNVLAPHFTGTPSAAQVLDVACGSGLVGKVMSQLGFRLFVGVDASEGMLKEAQQTGLYQRLQLAVVGKHPLPVDAGAFDVVTVVGGLYPGFIPVKAVREFCNAAKPGGLVSLGRGNYPRPEYISYDEELERELQQMEREGLWVRLEATQVERYIANPDGNEGNDDKDKRTYIRGTVYVFRKSESAHKNSK